MNRREFLKGAALAAPGVCAGCLSPDVAARHGGAMPWAKTFTFVQNWGHDGGMVLPCPALPEPLKVSFIADAHLNLHDDRDRENFDYLKRMAGAKWSETLTAKDGFAIALKKVREAKSDLVVLLGDAISFPALANIEFLASEMDALGVPWLYVSGNHDWHFEGEPGTQAELRAKWTSTRMRPLYQGNDPMAYSKVVKGVRFVLIDNTFYEVTPEQLAFYRAEAAKGDPVCLCTHIPLWNPGMGWCACASPEWGTKADFLHQIERREKWPERASASTFAFREAVLGTPNLVACFAGHIHRWQCAQWGGQIFVTATCAMGGDIFNVTIGG